MLKNEIPILGISTPFGVFVHRLKIAGKRKFAPENSVCRLQRPLNVSEKNPLVLLIGITTIGNNSFVL